jgi:coenzyme F420-0:L-glutamate ligase/coenzyme F420-1:gamma-L-glutamate ligase
MNIKFTVMGLRTGIIIEGDDIAKEILRAAEAEGGIQNGDILVIAENAVATAEGRLKRLSGVRPSQEADDLATRYNMDPRLVEAVLGESDEVVGGIPGFLLCMKNGTLLPNAGIDQSNAPEGSVVLLPLDPDASAEALRSDLRERTGMEIAVIIADSRTHAMRLGCSGVAIGCAGMVAVVDERGRKDLFGRELHVTKRAVADNIASAAELVMGESDECTPVAIVRGLACLAPGASGVETIAAEECLFMGVALGRNRGFGERKEQEK